MPTITPSAPSSHSLTTCPHSLPGVCWSPSLMNHVHPLPRLRVDCWLMAVCEAAEKALPSALGKPVSHLLSATHRLCDTSRPCSLAAPLTPLCELGSHRRSEDGRRLQTQRCLGAYGSPLETQSPVTRVHHGMGAKSTLSRSSGWRCSGSTRGAVCWMKIISSIFCILLLFSKAREKSLAIYFWV